MPAFLLPDLGEGLTEAEIVAWHVRAGDTVMVDQNIAEVETAKAVVEVPVPFAGRVTRLHGTVGDVVAVGQPLITVEAPPPARPGETAEAEEAAVAAGAEESGNVLVGYGTARARDRRRRPSRSATATTAEVSTAGAGTAGAGTAGPGTAGPGTTGPGTTGPGTTGPGTTGPGTTGPGTTGPGTTGPGTTGAGTTGAGTTGAGSRAGGSAPPPCGRVAVASPLIRRLARNAGLDLTAIRGSGRDGLITRHDVDAAIEASLPAPSPARSAAPLAGGPPSTGGPATGTPTAEASRPAAEPAGLVRIPLRGLRRAAADKVSRSRREIPEATVWVDVDATALTGLRATLNAAPAAPPISVLALLARFTILGLRRYPELNARIDGDEIVLNPSVHLGFAAQTGRGLLVPVVPDAQALTLEQLSVALAERAGRARAGSLGPGELTGGTFTVNNYGVFGVDGSAAIINYPEAAILGMGRIIERPWVVGGAVVPRQMTELTLAFDHRICDGGTAGGFLRFVADCIESPANALRYL